MHFKLIQRFIEITRIDDLSGGQLLEIWLLDTFGRKSTARHKIYQLLKSS
jgi:hypothetical protein